MLKVTVEKRGLMNPLSQVQTIVDKKAIMTIINNILIYTDEENIFIEATDLEINYRTKVKCSVIEQGALTINARKFYEIIKEFPLDIIDLEEQENFWIKIGGGENAQYKIAGLPPDDFPRFRHMDENNAIRLTGSLLKEMIEKTIYSTSGDDTKYSLAGIYFEQSVEEDGPTMIRMVSSDGHRLSLVEKTAPGKGLDIKSGFIIPRKGALEIKRLVEGRDEATFGCDENFLFVRTGDDFLVIRLVDGRFPNYRAIIPASKERALTFNRMEVYNTLKRISILSFDTTFRGVKAVVAPGGMEIESLQKEIGEAREVVRVNYDGEPFTIALNAKYMMGALGVMTSDEVEMTANNAESPVVLRARDDEGFLGLIMPMSLPKEEDSPEAH